MNPNRLLRGLNAGYVLELYDRYQDDPLSVDAATRALFAVWTPADAAADAAVVADAAAPTTAAPVAPPAPNHHGDRVAGVVNLANALREYGHLAARSDPLGSTPLGDPALDPATYGLSDADLAALPGHLVGGPIGASAADARAAIDRLRRVYTHTVGYDCSHVNDPEERAWLREAAESRRYHPDNLPIDPLDLLQQLTRVEGFELFLQRAFPGKTRFSIEGLDMLAPMLEVILQGAADQPDLTTILIGMAHRGRLNVLAHVLQKPYRQILAEFKDPVYDHVYTGWSGDVKYHEGAQRRVVGRSAIDVRMAPNPSHLELVNPVIAGMARAAGSVADRPGMAHFHRQEVLPILIHGDAAFAGQGVVAETLNFGQVPGWRVGGSIHVIANNQIGFTTDQEEARSTRYAGDLARGFRIPIVHVNADDPEACIEVARLALAYQTVFEKDLLIDLVGYRRHGHNEGDEPRFTQPGMYRAIDALPSVRVQWARTLEARGLIAPDTAERLLTTHLDEMQALFETLDAQRDIPKPDLAPHPPGAARRVETAVPLDELRALNRSLLQRPDRFQTHPRLTRLFERRAVALDDPDAPTIDWATAEALALASILAEGTPIRFTGQDVERGTFSHRHMALHDVETGARYIPFHHLSQARAGFEGRNSPLSENAVLGFEYGYSVAAPERLVIWEAQYGDFINGAQPIIDQFIASGHAKWGLESGLVLLLPHGYEGQGPDHSSGRLERFLQLAAETNLRIAYPTTAAQYFHLLRRQAKLLTVDPLPLIVMTPKSLLRHPQAASTPRALSEGRWRTVLDDPRMTTPEQRAAVRRLILCSGKVYVDLATSDLYATADATAIARLEQIYRHPLDDLADLLNRYPQLDEVVWLQEEPQNMGAYSFIEPYLRRLIDGRWPLRFIGRGKRAGPAEGSTSRHKVNQAELIRQALG